MKRSLFLTLSALLLVFSCAKEREAQFVQGFPADAIEKKSIESKEYTLTTFEELSGDSLVSNANQIEVEDNDLGFSDLRRVRYETNAPFFDEIPFLGRPNTTYKLRYELKDNKLIISKIGQAKDIPFNERLAAKDLGNGLLITPIVSYDIDILKAERVRNANNEETHEIRSIKATSINEASHIIVKEESRSNLTLTYNNVFKSNLFDGQWFFAATVVSASPEQANSIGRDVSMDFKARSVSRIKFEKYEDSIVGQNLNIDDNLDASDDINLKEAISIPAKYFDIKEDGFKKIVQNPLARVDEEDYRSFSRSFEKREYMELDFTQVLSAMTRASETTVCDEGVITEDGEQKQIRICRQVTRPGLDLSRATLDSLEVANDYIAFVVYHKAEKVKIRYSLRKAHTPKKGRTYFKDDRKTFGFFGSTKFAILNHRYEREDAREKLTFLNRFYPENGRIVYYFSKRTPEHMKEAGREAIKVWDEAFKKAETGIRIVLDESKTVNLGDIRYNIINIVDTKDGARLLGYGPSIVDSESGEIISATSNIYANPFRESWINTLRNYIRSEIGMLKTKQIGVPSPDKMTFYTDVIERVLENNSENYVPSLVTGADSFINSLGLRPNSNIDLLRDSKNKVLKEEGLSIAKESQTEGMFHFNAFDRTNKDSIEEIKNICGDSITDYIETLKEQNLTHTEEELKILNGCADKLLQKSVVATLIHELGHNFGLRHNFIASTDTENFIINEDGSTPANTASIMDYQPSNVKELLVPGPYDVAAIRFGYANKIKLQNGLSANVSPNQSLKSQIENKSMDPIKYKFCTDEDVQRFDPLCQRHDDGRNPLEIVKNTIDSFYSSYAVYGNRFDRANGPSSARFALSHLQRTFIPLKLIYDQWRHHLREYLRTDAGLNTSRGSENNIYLEDFKEEEFKEMIQRMKNSGGQYGKVFNDYYEASELAYNFLKEIIFTPAKVCVGKLKNNSPDATNILIDFEEVKQGVFSNSSVTIDSCEHVLAIEHLNNMGMEYAGTFGTFYEEQKESLDIRDMDYRLSNTVGFEQIRRSALLALTIRTPLMEHLSEKDFRPNFLDNPVYRREILDMTFKRVLEGLDSKPFGFENDAEYTNVVFVREKDFLRDLTVSVVKGIGIPNDITKSGDRIAPFRPDRTTNPNIIDEAKSIITTYRHFYIFTERGPENRKTIAHQLIEKREDLRKLVNDLNNTKPFNDRLASQAAHALNLAGISKNKETLAAMTVLEYNEYLGTILNHAEQEIKDDLQPDVGVILKLVYSNVRMHFLAVAQGAIAEVGDRETIANMNVVEFLKDKEEFTVNDMEGAAQENIVDALQPHVQTLKEQRNQSSKASPFKKEIEAHLDLLTQILMTI